MAVTVGSVAKLGDRVVSAEKLAACAAAEGTAKETAEVMEAAVATETAVEVMETVVATETAVEVMATVAGTVATEADRAAGTNRLVMRRKQIF